MKRDIAGRLQALEATLAATEDHTSGALERLLGTLERYRQPGHVEPAAASIMELVACRQYEEALAATEVRIGTEEATTSALQLIALWEDHVMGEP